MTLSESDKECLARFDKSWTESMGLETDPNGDSDMFLIRDEEGTVLNGIDFSEEKEQIKLFLLKAREEAYKNGYNQGSYDEAMDRGKEDPASLSSASYDLGSEKGYELGIQSERNRILALIGEDEDEKEGRFFDLDSEDRRLQEKLSQRVIGRNSLRQELRKGINN